MNQHISRISVHGAWQIVVAGMAFLSLGAAGCATVQPWQRGRLAHESMSFATDAASVAYEAHWQESREGAAGGLGVQSGGCGCK